MIAVIVARTATAPISPPSGWTLIRRDMSGNVGDELTQILYYRVGRRDEQSSYTWRFDAPISANGAIVAYRGVMRQRPIETHAGLYTHAAAIFAAPSVRTATKGSRLLAFFGSTGTNGITPPNGMTEIFDVVGSNVGVAGAGSSMQTVGRTGAKRAVDAAGAANTSNFGQLVALRSACSATSGPPRVGQRPVILDTAYVGRAVTSYAGAWCGKRPVRLTFKWARCGSNRCKTIKGANRRTYTPTRRDIGANLTFLVTSRNAAGTTTMKSTGKRVGWTRPANAVPPVISGTARAGFEVTASTGSWTGVEPIAYAYQWKRCDAGGSSCGSIADATEQTYVLGAADVGATIRVVVTASNSSGSASATSNQTAVVVDGASSAPTNSGLPTVSGDAMEGATLSGSAGAWSGTAPILFEYEWQRCDGSGLNCVALPGVTGERYVVAQADVDSTLRLVVEASNALGSSSSRSLPTRVVVSALAPPLNTVPPAITGMAEVGSELNASTGTWTGAAPITYSYQWHRCDKAGENCSSISGATRANYPVTYGDGGSTLRVLVTAANAVGSNVTRSAQTEVVPASGSSIYWGAYIDGTPTYDSYYGGSWGDAPWDANTWTRFEANSGKKVSIVHWGLGTPWAHDFEDFESTFNLVRNAGELNLVDMTTGTVPLRDITSGRYDMYLKAWVEQAAAWGYPFFLALDVEMNGSWMPYGTTSTNQNSPEDFIAAWRHFHDLAEQAGASNITWVWCPNVDPRNLFTPYEKLYPGDTYVDWTGLDGFNKDGTQTFSWLFGSSYQKLLQIAPTKPIMISQTSSVEGGIGKAAWITEALSTQLPQNFPQVKALVWFNWRIYETNKWWEWPIESSSTAQTAFQNAISSPYYTAGGGFSFPRDSKIPQP